VLPGTILALVAFVGVEGSLTGHHAAWRPHKGAAITIRAAMPTVVSARSVIGASLTFAAGGLVLLLLLSRRTPILARAARIEPGPGLSRGSSSLGLIHQRTSISYHTGGLYGP
jgi:hypothetical protein